MNYNIRKIHTGMYDILPTRYSRFERTLLSTRLKHVDDYDYTLDFDKELMSLTDVDLAGELILKHLDMGSHIALVTDYDADGITSAVILFKMLKIHLKYDMSKVTTIINHRKNGNGVNDVLYQRIMATDKDSKIGLVILADHGTASEKNINKLTTNGIEVLLTDHHQIPKNNPPVSATVFVNNQRTESTFASSTSGGFIAFMAMLATYKKRYGKIDIQSISDVLAYVALTTISDQMDMSVPINRVITKIGYMVADLRQDLFWKHIYKKKGITTGLTSKIIGFDIAPLINTTGRMNQPELAFRMMTTEDPAEINSLYTEINRLNDIRKKLQREAISGCMGTVVNSLVKHKHSMAITLDKGMRYNGEIVSINGIIAGMLANEHRRPTVCFIDNGETLTGSARGGIDGIDLPGIFKDMSLIDKNMILFFGGHSGAAGIAIRKNKLDVFSRIFDEVTAVHKADIDIESAIYYDVDCGDELADINTIDSSAVLQHSGRRWSDVLYKSTVKIFNVKPIGSFIIVTIISDVYGFIRCTWSMNNTSMTLSTLVDTLCRNTIVDIYYTAAMSTKFGSGVDISIAHLELHKT